MRRKEDRPISKHTLNLFEGDFSWLQNHHGRLGAGKVIRELVHAHRRKVEETVAQRTRSVTDLNLKLDEVMK